MPRLGYQKEEAFRNLILDAIPFDPPGATWKEIEQHARTRGKTIGIAVGTEALDKYLKQLVGAGMVHHQGRFYRGNPALGHRFDIYNQVISGHLPERSSELFFENFRSQPLQAIYDWTTIGFPFGEVKTKEDVVSRTKLTLTYIFLQYLSMMQELVDIPKKAGAREFVDLFNKVKIQPLLISLAHAVWEKRGQVRLRNLNLHDEMESFAQYGVRPPKMKPATGDRKATSSV